jgi:protein phosphatase
MGGHAGGEVAAQVAVDALRLAFSRDATVDGFRQSVTEANSAVWRRSQIQSELRGMGTTLTAVALVSGADGQDVIALANVGDSRAYVYSAGRITQITVDHSLAEEKVLQGELTEAEAAVHPHRHILTRALGVSSDVDVDLWELHLQAGDRILLCSDGLTNEVGADQLAEVLGREPDPAAAARMLVDAANEHGGNDNITVVVVDVLVGEGGAQDLRRDSTAEAATALEGATRAGHGSGAVLLTGVVPAQASANQRIGGQVPVLAPPHSLRGTVPGTWTGPAQGAPETGGKLSRGERSRQRRLAGIPRRVTFRVLLFTVLLVAVVAAAYGFVRWYATDNWYVTLDGSHLAIYQGRPGGLLGFEPKLVDRTEVTTADVLPFRVPALRDDKQEPSLSAARRYIANLQQELQSQRAIASGQSTTPTTTTTTSTTTTSTTATATTTVPGGST